MLLEVLYINKLGELALSCNPSYLGGKNCGMAGEGRVHTPWRNHLYSINRVKNFVPQKTLKALYFSLFHSHLLYCPIIVSCASKTNIHKIEVMQKKLFVVSTILYITPILIHYFQPFKFCHTTKSYINHNSCFFIPFTTDTPLPLSATLGKQTPLEILTVKIFLFNLRFTYVQLGLGR